MRILYILILLLLSFSAFGQVVFIKNIKIVCDYDELCSRHKGKFSDLLWKEIETEDIKENFKGFLVDASIRSFSYDIFRTGSGHNLIIKINHKKIVDEVRFNANHEVDYSGLKKQLPFGSGDYFNERIMPEVLAVVNKFMIDKGLGNNTIEYKVVSKRNYVDLEFNINVGQVITVEDVDVFVENKNFEFELKSRFLKFKNKVWDRIGYMVAISQMRKELFNKGHLFSKIEMLPPVEVKDKKKVRLQLKIKLGEKFNFYFQGNNIFSRQDILGSIKKLMKDGENEVSRKEIKNSIINFYENFGVYNTKIEIAVRRGTTKNQIDFTNYYIEIEEGKKVVITERRYLGHGDISKDYLEKLFYKNATTLASGNFLDKKFMDDFSDIIRIEYLKRGHIFVEVSPPKTIFDEKRQRVIVAYEIDENRKCLVSKINLKNITGDLELKLKEITINKEGVPLNVIELKNDLNNMLEAIKQEGYFFAKIDNLKEDSLLRYYDNFSQVEINVNFNIGQKILYDGVLITGNSKTRLQVIQREIDFQRGEVVTPEKIDELKTRLVSLGIFSFVRISPMLVKRGENKGESYANLLVMVREVDFGVIEIAPGYRTDIGIKASTMVRYNNLGGVNRAITTKLQGNQRLDYNNLDDRRREEKKKVLEFMFKVNFSEPYLFPYLLGKRLEFDSSISSTLKRFYGFDANIFRGSVQVAKKYTSYFSTALSYQWEYISQFDATEERNKGDFRIGGIMPSVSFDFRDNKVIPRRGTFFGLSCEYVHPKFGSKSNEKDIEINYFKLISRNMFYFLPLDNVGLAFSYAFGIQRDLSTGYIPSIKVFRLNGQDLIRGYEDDEINRLDAGHDISEQVIDETAFFSAFKVELRYYFSDNLVLGPFYDSGKISTDGLHLFDSRKSAGITFKLLTPVGSLDFDYGVKLRRKRFDSDRETFGKFHISIGFF